ncbi:MAG: universal stress protein [Desulfobulbaceae bacterium]|nr:MAG: universal stress protein [Desulfobulbaceae bacterium]
MPLLPDFKTILYATDLGPNVRPVFRAALSIARKFQAKIIMLHVVEPMSPAIQAVVDTYLTELDAKKIHKDGMQEVLATMKERLKSYCEDELDTHDIGSAQVKEMLVVSGKTSEEIIRAANKHNADLIVLGKSTRNIMGSDVAGSAARRVSRYSDIPVFIVPNN